MKKTVKALVATALLSSVLSASLPVQAVETTQSMASTLSATAQNKPLINLNNATIDELQLHLSGIGLTKAQNIVEYREKYGPFVSVNQLLEVQGIGPSLLERNREKLEI